MGDDQALINTRSCSSESSIEGVDVFTDRGSHASSSKERDSREFLMLPPEEKLQHFDSSARGDKDSREQPVEGIRNPPSYKTSDYIGSYDACIQDLVRCVALTRLIYGERHLKRAQAHARLAKAYLQFKGWGLQAMEHLVLAKEQLPFCSSYGNEKLEVLTCLLSIHLTQGAASLLTDNLEDTHSSFLEADKILEDLHQHNAINHDVKIKTRLEITSGLHRFYKRQNQLEEALLQCEKSLQLLKDCNELQKTCSVYRDMAAIEQDRGHVGRAVQHLTKAHAIAMSHTPEGLEGAQISHSLALILSSAAESHHNDTADHYFEQSLGAYKKSVGPQDPAFLAAQDDFCRFLLISGQQEKCVAIQRASLDSKRSTFGDMSSEVADTLQLIGSVEMAKGQMDQAHKTMTKCLKIQNLLYGPQHKKAKATQKAVNMLARTPEVVERQRSQSRRGKKAETVPVVSISGNDDNSTSDI